MNTTTRQLTAVLALLAAACATTGCNTIHGAGQDIERAGEEIQDAAD
ncbi:MAG: entericidin A/B family lipoprotein [Xanthomonadales bacterium]|nr:entericidin A/B family lipoprotein [Xanthomonadales bacterium]